MIEPCSQTGHCRRMASAQLAAQSVSSLCGGTESGIKRIVSIGARPRTLTCQDLRRKRSSFLPEDKIPTGDKENRILPEIYRVVEYGVHVIPDIAPPRICAGTRSSS